mgnify:CR=1 FL=1
MSEKIVEKQLKMIGTKFVIQKIMKWGEAFRYADFFIPWTATIIEVDGEYHLNFYQINRDRSKDFLANLKKYNTLRIKNEDANNFLEIYFEHLKKIGREGQANKLKIDFRRGEHARISTEINHIHSARNVRIGINRLGCDVGTVAGPDRRRSRTIVFENF